MKPYTEEELKENIRREMLRENFGRIPTYLNIIKQG
jgi:hypothetical protein